MARATAGFLRYTRAPAGWLVSMETRVKERLLGAVILVALIVALVPEILSGPHGPSSGADAANSESMRTYTVDLEARGAPAGETRATPTPDIALPEQPAATPVD